jgi:hypothetical protein
MKLYRVDVTRETSYDVKAEDEDDAIDRIIIGEGDEIHQETLDMRAESIDESDRHGTPPQTMN